jgi:dephospho-CoA kinase
MLGAPACGVAMTIAKIALFGVPGAGKSTSARLLNAICDDQQIVFRRLRLAEPLYQCQDAIYRIAGRPLDDQDVQDGELLNFLGSHLRKINRSVLTDAFAKQLYALLNSLDQSDQDRVLVVCDDMRATEAAFLRTEGFVLVRIDAPSKVRRRRLASRGDRTLGAEDHPTEAGVDAVRADATIHNDNTMAELRDQLKSIIRMAFA